MTTPPTDEVNNATKRVEPRASYGCTTDPCPWHPVLAEVGAERERQDEKWGEQNHPDGTGENLKIDRELADLARRLCQQAAKFGWVTWRLILEEEMREAFAEQDPAKLRAELVQIAAVATAWIEAIDRRLS